MFSVFLLCLPAQVVLVVAVIMLLLLLLLLAALHHTHTPYAVGHLNKHFCASLTSPPHWLCAFPVPKPTTATTTSTQQQEQQQQRQQQRQAKIRRSFQYNNAQQHKNEIIAHFHTPLFTHCNRQLRLPHILSSLGMHYLHFTNYLTKFTLVYLHKNRIKIVMLVKFLPLLQNTQTNL